MRQGTITATMLPVAQARPRVVKRGSFIHTYDPSEKQKHDFIKLIKTQLPKDRLTGAIELDVAFYCKRPNFHFSTSGALKKNVPVFKTTKPDIDNLLKFVLDALNGHLYRDDSQIVSIKTRKYFHDVKEKGEIVINFIEY